MLRVSRYIGDQTSHSTGVWFVEKSSNKPYQLKDIIADPSSSYWDWGGGDLGQSSSKSGAMSCTKKEEETTPTDLLSTSPPPLPPFLIGTQTYKRSSDR